MVSNTAPTAARAEFPQLPFAGLRVVEQSSGIAAAYCGKMLLDAGAEVVKIEPLEGDPMRYWRLNGDPDAAPGALFGYLAAGKKSAFASSAHGLFAAADVVITDLSDGSTLSETASRTVQSSAVIVAVTPFGFRGPLAEANGRVNEFVLQAMCGSIGGRGWPGEEPLQAGGRIGEWVAGSFAAVTAAACARQARRTGRGELVDVSVYESMVLSMGSLPAMAHSVLGDDVPVSGRSIELPSIVSTADGLVGFCTITAQQFEDFLILIDRPDLLGDAELASFAGRMRRRDEFLSIVNQWAQRKKTQDVIELASALRIPVAPIATPGSVMTIDHFVERGVFAMAPDGAVHPRVPYRSPAITTRAPLPAPELGAHSRRIVWDTARSAKADPSAVESALPLSDIRILDLTAFWAGPVATSVLAALGADVIKVEGVRRPDGMRFANGRPPSWEQWWEWGPVYLCSNSNKRALSLELTRPEGQRIALEAIGHSDLIIENYSPRVLHHFGLDWDAVRAVNPAVSMVRMPAFGLDGPWRDRVGFAQTMEQASGMAWMTGRADGPPIVPRGPCDPIAGLHAAFAAIAALEVRDRTDHGIHVESTMVEAAVNVAAEAVMAASRDGITPTRDGNRGPGACPQGVYPCAADDSWVAIALLRDEDWPALAILVGQPELAADPTLSAEFSRRARADEIDVAIRRWTEQRSASGVVDELTRIGVGSARVVLEPADLLADEHLGATGFWEVVDHPVAGRFKTTGMPFTFAGRERKWIRTPAPTYGEHNREVLVGVLGKCDSDIEQLKAIGVVSDRPAGL